MLLVVDGRIIQAYYAEKTGTTYFTVADGETLTSLELSSTRLGANEVKPFVDQPGRIEVKCKVTKFQGNDRFEAVGFRFTPASALSEPAKSANGAKVPA